MTALTGLVWQKCYAMAMENGNKLARYPWLLVGGSLIGLVASVWQAAERIQMLKHPGVALSCNLNPVIDCGTVLGNRWASLFGFPNAFIGIAIFAMLLMAGVALATGTKPSKGFQRVLLAISIVLILFALWFFGMSLYVIGKVCIFCLFIWAVSVPIFWYGCCTIGTQCQGVARGLSGCKQQLRSIISTCR